MPYEGQPYQNAIFKKTNERGKQIETVGYIHSFPIGLPSNLAKDLDIRKNLSPIVCLKNIRL